MPVVPAPLRHDRQAPLLQRLAAGAPLDLAAGGLGQGAGADQDDPVHPQPVLPRHHLADAGEDLLEIGGRVARQLLDDGQRLHVPRDEGEGGGAGRAQGRMAPLHRPLDVLRIVVPSAGDDHVLEAAGHEETPAGEEPQVAGTQERSLPGIRRAGLEDPLRLLGAVPVAPGHSGSLHPDLPHLVRGADPQRDRVDDPQLRIRAPAATAHQPPAPLSLSGNPNAAALQGLGQNVEEGRTFIGRDQGNRQRGFGQTIARSQRLAPQATGREHLDKALQSGGPDGLRAVARHPPATQVEVLQIFGSDLAGAQVVGEIGSRREAAAIPGDRAQPAQRPLQESRRAHCEARNALQQRRQDAEDQTHVVEHGEPGHHHIFHLRLSAPDRQQNAPDVMDQVGVTDDDPLRVACGARGVLEEGGTLGRHLRRGETLAETSVEPVDGQNRQGAALAEGGAVEPGQDGAGGEDHRGPGVARHGRQALQLAAACGRGDRHGDHAGVQAAQESLDEVEPGREQEQRPIAGAAVDQQPGGDLPGGDIERTAGETLLLALPFFEESV